MLTFPFHRQNLYWDMSPDSNSKLCYSTAKVPRHKATLLADFKSSGGLRHGWDYLATLEITKEGQEDPRLIEHVLVSALILERLWLTPDGKNYESRPASPTEQLQSATTSSTSVSDAASQALPAIPEPVTLTWDPDSDSTSRNPPESHSSTENIEYKFTQVSMNAMAMEAPPPVATRMFHISVESNCFIPSAFVTTIREGGTENGTFLASFQTGVVQNTNVPELKLGIDHLAPKHWQFESINLYWDVQISSSKIKRKLCYDSPKFPRTKATLLAEFKSTDGLQGQGSDYPATLEVTREGHQEGLLEHILVSALISERLELSQVRKGYPQG
ncbi:para-aminobenzoate synthase, (PABA) [Marasmius crinis-equi]|uniref:Para-aminobenzoate synthase, (PABA) n=1 Tax=Marasmius crinis-equi TaxID=585013 RepID=A0ABR3FRF2_9AGAR